MALVSEALLDSRNNVGYYLLALACSVFRWPKNGIFPFCGWMKFPWQYATNSGSTDQRRSLNHPSFFLSSPIYTTLSNPWFLIGNAERSETAHPWKKLGEFSVTEISQGSSSALCVHSAKLCGEGHRGEQAKLACLLGHLKELCSWRVCYGNWNAVCMLVLVSDLICQC